MIFEKIKFATEQEKVVLIKFFNYPILKFYQKYEEEKKHYNILPVLKKNYKYCASSNTDVFYLKINREDQYTYHNLQHWINIVYEYGGDFYIICDNLELEKKVYQNIKFRNHNVKIIKSIRNDYLTKIVKYIATPLWVKATYAQLTTFLHSKEHNIKSFWNIDADDTMFCIPPKVAAEFLNKVKEKAKEDNIDAFSFDMHRSRTNGHHWSFGITYIQNNLKWFNLFEQNNDTKWRDKYLDLDYEFNLDWFFTYLKDNDIAKCDTYSTEDMLFIHYGDIIANPIYAWIGIWQNNKIKFPILLDLYGSKKYGEIESYKDIIKIRTNINLDDCYKYMTKYHSYLEISSKQHDNMWGKEDNIDE